WRINVSGVDGPYSVELSLYERTYGLSDTGVHTTAEYSHLEFESPPAYLVPPFADAGVDTNGNGRFDDLVVDVNLTVEQTDYYGLHGNLRELDVSASTSWRSYGPGSYSVQLLFDGIAINEKGIDGPYVVDLTLYMRDWQIGFNNDTTGPYPASGMRSSGRPGQWPTSARWEAAAAKRGGSTMPNRWWAGARRRQGSRTPSSGPSQALTPSSPPRAWRVNLDRLRQARIQSVEG